MNLPSVTTILSPWADFSRVSPEVLAAAAHRGTVVHRACAAEATGLWYPPIAEKFQGYVQSFRIWFERAVDTVIFAEAELTHPVYGYCGHPDFLLKLKGDEKPAVIDVKTPLSQNKAWRLQLAGYHELIRVNGYDVFRNMAVRLRKDGRAPIVNDYTGTQAGDLSIFLSCLHAWSYFHQGELA